MKKRSRHSPGLVSTVRVVDVVHGTRKSWQVTLVQENDQILAELRLASRAPGGSLSMTGHRSVFQLETLRKIIEVLQAAETELAACDPLPSLIRGAP